MKRYEHVQVHYTSVITTDTKVIKAMVPEIEQLVAGKIQVRQDNRYSYTFEKLHDEDHLVAFWMREWLCRNGWEPFAAHPGAYTAVLHFRKEIE